jgi:putative hydrolase of the HAD superfamily
MRVKAVCFDYGGTLDGPGSHWLDRFLQLYRAAGVPLSFERFRDAFDHATQSAYADPAVAAMGLEALIEYHVAHQNERLGLPDGSVSRTVVRKFVAASRAALADSRLLLDRLRRRVALGVVSNFYGNVDRLLAEAGIAPWLDVIVDSNRAGVSKPDPAIFVLAVRQLGCAAADTLYVGDSFDKDIVPAHGAGLRTAWVTGDAEPPCPAPQLVDVRLRRLTDLESVLE